jgi:hypothetical protein
MTFPQVYCGTLVSCIRKCKTDQNCASACQDSLQQNDNSVAIYNALAKCAIIDCSMSKADMGPAACPNGVKDAPNPDCQACWVPYIIQSMPACAKEFAACSADKG